MVYETRFGRCRGASAPTTPEMHFSLLIVIHEFSSGIQRVKIAVVGPLICWINRLRNVLGFDVAVDVEEITFTKIPLAIAGIPGNVAELFRAAVISADPI